MNLYEIHERMTAHLFPAYSSTDERFLSLALCGEAAELADLAPDDGANLSKDKLDDAREELADCRVYLELLAKCFGIEGSKLPVIRMAYLSDCSTIMKLCAQSGLLANLIKKRWRDGAKNDDACREKIIEVRAYIELMARNLHIEGNELDRRVVAKLERVVEKHKAKLGLTLNAADADLSHL